MDRRRHERRDLEAAPLKFLWKDQKGVRHRGEGIVHNISGGGLYVSTPDPPPVGAPVRFDVFFPYFLAGSRLVLRTTAQVVRVDSSSQGEGLAGFGVVMRTYTLRKEKEVVQGKNL